MPEASPRPVRCPGLSDAQVRRLWALLREAQVRPWSWRDEVRYRLRIWRRIGQLVREGFRP